ncbi:MAG TPA: flagellar hook-associated protein FlgK [Bryobacteraceae bacterium]|nr:flagellar hook-associated protein FlgK [Bryobacteraceae bacterium]
MGGLFGALNSSVSALDALQNALDVAQNNVSNSSTPGYSNQIPTFEAQPFNVSGGLDGGVNSGPTQSTDDVYADQAVWTQLAQQGNYTAQSTALSSIQSLFDVTGQTGVLGALNNLFQSFSAWSTDPDSSSNQQDVISQAQAFAEQFQSAASSLSQTTTQLNQQISGAVGQINSLASQIATDNAAIAQSQPPDPNVQANLQAAIENLSQVADVTVQYASNGTATVLLGGQSELVVGSQQYSIQANFANATGGNANAVPNAQILDSNGDDITADISQGSLGGLLYVRNTVLPSLQGNGQQQGSLNVLAQQVADQVNQILTSAQTTGGQAGTALFTYDAASPVDVAATLAVNPSITGDELAPVDPGPPEVGNGAALALSNLGNSTASTSATDGQTILEYSASIATQVGQQASDAQTGQTLHTQLLAQAQSVQTQISGVSLDAEAALVLQLQEGYDAAGKMVTVISSLATTLINMVPSTA